MTFDSTCMKSFIILSFCLLFMLPVKAQSEHDYEILLALAGLFHLQKNPKNAIRLYEEALKIKQPDALTAYKIAGVYSLDGNAERAFHYLNLALSAGWTEADWLSFDPYFDYLRENYSERWNVIKQQSYVVEQQLEKRIALPSLRREINFMTLNDQKLRYEKIQNKEDNRTEILDKAIQESDIKNLARAKEIIKQYGWLKKSQIGKDGQNNLWLIVQHADNDVLFQQEVLSEMKKLKASTEIDMENYAFLYDRVQCNLNFKQLFGTQVVWTNNGEASAFRPISEEYLADVRRKELGLKPLAVYALNYGFSYDNLDAKESKIKDSLYQDHVRILIDSAKYFYTKKQFQKTYDYYNTASTYLGGMTNENHFEAAIIFSKIAAENKEPQYKSIALDFLELNDLRKSLTKAQLAKQNAFKTLYKEPRWVSLYNRLASFTF